MSSGGKPGPRTGFLLAHDTGTGGNKAVLTDLEGRVIRSAYRSYPVQYPRPDWAEQDPEVLWSAVAGTTREVIAASGVPPDSIMGVGISAQMFNLLPVDEGCRPLTPMLSWLDIRSADQADRLLQGDLPAFLFRHTGNIPTAKDIIPKILWLREERPEVWARTWKLLDCKEYILHRLTGRVVTDWHGASVYFLFDPHRNEWSKQACDRLDIPFEMLPEARPCTEVIGEVTPGAASQTGLAAGTPVVACAGDVAVAQVGAGASGIGRAHLSVGTATWVGLSIRPFINDSRKPFWGLSHIAPDRWILAGEMETGGGALMWFRDALCQEEKAQARAQGTSAYVLLSRMADEVPPGSDRLLFAPWLSGERAPILDHYARGAWVGLGLGHTKAHLTRAVMEGVAFHMRWVCEAIERLGQRIGPLHAIGGGSTSPVWVQILADIIGKPLHVVEHPLEAGARGAALTVAVGLGLYPSMDAVDDLIHIERRVEPRLEFQARYDQLFGEYRQVYSALASVFRRLHDIP